MEDGSQVLGGIIAFSGKSCLGRKSHKKTAKMESSNEALLAAAAGVGKLASPAPSTTTMTTSVTKEGRNPSPTNPLPSPIPTTLAPLVLHGHEDADAVDEDDVRYNYSPDDDEEDDYDDDSSEDGEIVFQIKSRRAPAVEIRAIGSRENMIRQSNTIAKACCRWPMPVRVLTAVSSS